MSSPKNWNWFFSRSRSSGSWCVEIAELGDEALVVQEVDLQPHERLALAVQREPGVVHAEVVEVEQRVRRLRVERGRVERARGHRDQRLVEVGGEADARRVRHRVERAALLVVEGLPDAQVVEGAVRHVRVAAGDRAVGADDDRARRAARSRSRRTACRACWCARARRRPGRGTPAGRARPRRARRASAGAARPTCAACRRPSR